MNHPAWGYRPNGDALIFDDGVLPEGWSPTPDVIEDPARATAAALSAAAEGRIYAPPAAEVDPLHGSDAVAHSDALVEEALSRAVEEIDRLRGIIREGMSENTRLAADVNALDRSCEEAMALAETAKADLDRALAQVGTLTADLAKAQADGGFSVAEMDEAKATIARLTGELDSARADLDAATKPRAGKPGR